MKTRVTISVKLEYDGKKYNKKAVLTRLSSGSFIINEKVAFNDCIDIQDWNFEEDGYWSVFLELDAAYQAEIRLKYDYETYSFTLDHLPYSLIWAADGGILDEVYPIIKVTER